MKINGYWLAFGLLSLTDYTVNLKCIGYNFNWIQLFNVLFVFIGFGLAFKVKKTRRKNERRN